MEKHEGHGAGKACAACGKAGAPLSLSAGLCEECWGMSESVNRSARQRVREMIGAGRDRDAWLADDPGMKLTVRELLPCKPGVIARADAWVPTTAKPFLVLHGASHKGKTRLAVLTAGRLAGEMGVPPAVIWPGTMGAMVAEAWCDGEGAAAALLARWSGAPLVLLDDLDKVKPTERACEFLLSVLKARARRALPTIITTNLTGDEFRAQFGAMHGAPIANELRAYSSAIHAESKDA